MASIKEKPQFKKKQWLNKRVVLAAVGTAALANLGPAAKYAMATATVPPLVDVNFYDDTASSQYGNATGAAVIGATGNTWNNIGVNGSGVPAVTNSASGIHLNTVAGATSGYTLSYSTYASGNSTATGAPDQQLMQQYLVAKFNVSAKTNTVTISGLSDNTVYDLYVYTASSDGVNNQRATTVTAYGQSASSFAQSATASGNRNNVFAAGDNYVRLTPMSSSTGTITINQALQAGAGEADLNGLQIVSAVDTFTQTSGNSDSTGTNFWSTNGNWNTGSAAGATNTVSIPASSAGTYYNADLNGTSPTVIGLNIGAGSSIYNSSTSAETLTIAPGTTGYNSIIAGNIGSVNGPLPGDNNQSGASGGTVNLVINGGSNSVSGQLFDNLTLTINGGTTTLSGDNTYTGATTINVGTLALSGSGAIADSSGVTLASGSTLDISQTTSGATINGLSGNGSVSLGSKSLTVDVASGSTDTFGGAIQNGGIGSGTDGSLVLNGSGTLVLTGANSFSGGVNLNSGTLTIDSASAIGTGTLGFNGGTLKAGSGLSIANNVTIGAGGGSGTIDANGNDVTLANTISGSGALNIKSSVGDGSVVLSGNNTYTGGTMIDAGTTVMAGGDSAFGTGAIINAGTLATSNYMIDRPTPVVINASSLTLDSTSALDLAIFGNPASGNYNVVSLGSGTAQLAGRLNIRFINYVPSNGQTYTVIKTTGAVTGSFGSVLSNLSQISFMQSELAGSGYQITIQTSSLPQLFATTGLSTNQIQVADYVNNLSNQGEMPQSIVNPLTTMSFLSGSQLGGYLDALSPQVYAQITSPAIQNAIFENLSIDSHVFDAFHGGGWDTSGLALLKTSQTDPFALNLQSALQEADHQAQMGQSMSELDAAGIPPQGASMGTRWSGFVTGQIALDSAPQGSYPTQHYTTGSMMAGLDYHLDRHLLVGALFNYAYTGGTLDNLGSREMANSYAPGIFAGYKLGGLQIDGLGQYTFNDYKIDRNIVLPGYNSTATGEPFSNQFDASLMAEYYMHPLKGVDIGPSVGLGYTHMDVSSFTETGSPFALNVASHSIDSFRTLLGFQGRWHLNQKLMPLPLVVSFNGFWQHEYIGRSGALVASFSQIGGGSFLYNQPSPSRNSAILGLGIGGYLTKNTSLFVNYQTQIGDHRQFAQTVMAGLAIGF